MDEKLISKIDGLIEKYTESLIADTVKLVKIKSVQSEPCEGAPFGKGARQVLDSFLEMAKGEGLHTVDYEVGVVSAAMKEGKIDLGIWCHGDVVPEGEGWKFEPYGATLYKDCIIGRGTTDNKGQLAAIFNLFRIFKELGISLKYNPAIYLGSNEETGMRDIIGIEGNPDARGFINLYTPPRMSLVPDGSFPVGYGGKGVFNFALKSKKRIVGLKDLVAGEANNPGLARAVLEKDAKIPDSLDNCTVNKGEYTELTAFTPPVHTSSPNPDGNMITRLSEALLTLEWLARSDKKILTFLKDSSLDIHGENLGIAATHEGMSPLTLCAKQVVCEDGYPVVTYNIRYPISITPEELTERIKKQAAKRGFELHWVRRGSPAYLLDPENEIVSALCEASNSVTGEDKRPFTMSGSTYANRLPNAYVFGADGNLPPEDFEKGRGGAHGIDEAVSVTRLKRAMKIYARALLRLNEIEW